VKLSTQLLSYQSANPPPLVRRGSKEERRRRPPPKRSSLALKVQKLGGAGPDVSTSEEGNEDGECLEGEGGGVEVLAVEEVNEVDETDNTTIDSSTTTSNKSKKSWLSRSMGMGGGLSFNKGASSSTTDPSQDDEERDMELASILMERDELDLQLGLRNKERVGLELQLKAKAKELAKLETSLQSHVRFFLWILWICV
jgi:hypothetical protein